MTGGSDSGAVALALSFSGLPALTSLSGGDYFAITDISDGNTIKRKDIVDVGVYLVSGSTTLDHVTNGLIEVAAGGITVRELADDTITEPKLDISNTPTSGQVLSWDGSDLSWADAGAGTIAGVTAGTGLSGGGTVGTVTLDIENGGVGTAQLANFGVTVGKMAITNTPTSGQILSYAGPNMTWIDGSGTGDITAVTTASGSGLSGGVDTGAADLALDIAGLTNLSSTALDDSDILFIGDVSDSGDPRKHLTVGGLMSFATSGEATMDSGGGKLRVAAGGITTQEIADNTVTEPKLQIAGNPGTDNLLSWDGSALRWIPAFDLISLSGLGTVETGDLMLVSDTSDGGTSKRVQVLNVMNAFVATSTTLEVASDQLELSDGAVTEPKLSISGTPTTGQFIAWDGSGLEWSSVGGVVNNYVEDATLALTGSDLTLTLGRNGLGDVVSNVLTLPATGTGDITAVAAGVGLSGGGTSGDVTVNLNASGLNSLFANDLTSSDALIIHDSSDTANPKRISLTAFTSHITDNSSTVDASNGQIEVAAGGITARELANGTVTEPKLSITGTPATGQVIAWDGAGMEWATAAGAGDITAVNVGLGLSGGGTTGDVTIELDLIGLPVIATVQATDRVVLLDFSDSSLPKEIATSTFASEITPFLRLDQLTLESLIVGTDNFVFSDSSNANAIRRVTWGGAIARAADQNTLITANAVMRINDGGVGANELATDAVTQGKVADEAIDESRMDISNDPVDGYVISWDGTGGELVWKVEGGTPVPGTHTRYFALGTDRIFGEADYTGGLSFTSDVFTVPTFTVNSYFAIAVPATQPITSIVALTTPQQNLTSQFTQEADLVIAGENHNIWISTIEYFPVNSGLMIRIG